MLVMLQFGNGRLVLMMEGPLVLRRANQRV